MQKTMKTAKFFCHETFMVYGIRCHLQVNIFTKKLVILPIHHRDGAHWSLAVSGHIDELRPEAWHFITS